MTEKEKNKEKKRSIAHNVLSVSAMNQMLESKGYKVFDEYFITK